jgi:membrane fusion protein (multidrug efflux system)
LVRSGIKAGDRIVLSGIDKLQEGAVIKPEPVAADKAVAVAKN